MSVTKFINFCLSPNSHEITAWCMDQGTNTLFQRYTPTAMRVRKREKGTEEINTALWYDSSLHWPLPHQEPPRSLAGLLEDMLAHPLPGFQERVLRRKRLGVVQGKEKEDIIGLAPWTPMSQLTNGELSFLYFCPSAPTY